MRILAIFILLAVAALAQQDDLSSLTSASFIAYGPLPTTFASATATSSTSESVTHTVAVGKGGHSFSPDVTLAEVGDVIGKDHLVTSTEPSLICPEYQFYPTNHSVIRAAYGYSCVPYETVLGAGHYGFWSGFEPVDAVSDDPPIYQVTVNDTEAIFFYCGAPNSCIGYGMVGVINPNSSTSLEHQRQVAESSTFSLVPGEDWPSEGSIPSEVATTSATPAATSGTSPATGTPVPSSSVLSVGAIAGIAIGGAAVLLAAGVAIWFCGRQSRRIQTPTPGAPAQEINGGYVAPHASMYGKPEHMSTMSGYSLPPGYDRRGMQSPSMTSMPTPIDRMTGQQVHMMHSGAPSPNMQYAAPACAPNASM